MRMFTLYLLHRSSDPEVNVHMSVIPRIRPYIVACSVEVFICLDLAWIFGTLVDSYGFV